MLIHAGRLKGHETPDYEGLRANIREYAEKHGIQLDGHYDWDQYLSSDGYGNVVIRNPSNLHCLSGEGSPFGGSSAYFPPSLMYRVTDEDVTGVKSQRLHSSSLHTMSESSRAEGGETMMGIGKNQGQKFKMSRKRRRLDWE
jgi:hypothetical protein